MEPVLSKQESELPPGPGSPLPFTPWGRWGFLTPPTLRSRSPAGMRTGLGALRSGSRSPRSRERMWVWGKRAEEGQEGEWAVQEPGPC